MLLRFLVTIATHEKHASGGQTGQCNCKLKRKPDCKPGYVSDDHLSRTYVAICLKRPTWNWRAAYVPSRPCFGWGLQCGTCYQIPGGLLHRLFTLTGICRRLSLCCAFPGVASAGRYPASLPCEARTFLSRMNRQRSSVRLSGFQLYRIEPVVSKRRAL